MRIAFLTERMLVGFGVDLYIDQVAKRLGDRGHDVTVYAAQVDEAARTGGYRLERLPIEPARLYPLYDARARRWAGAIDAADHDVVVVETFPMYALIPALHTPTIAVDHGTSATVGMSPARRVSFAYVDAAKNRLFVPRATGVLAISEYIRSTMPRGTRGRCRVVYAGSDHYPAAPTGAREKVRAGLGVGDDEILALYVGRLNPEKQPYKGTADLLALAPGWRQRGIRLVMAGRAEPGDANRIASAGAICIEQPPASALADLYAAADVFVTASRWEGFDLPLAEAAYAGVPGVAFRIGAHPEVAVDGETAILVDDAEALGRGVEALAADPGRRLAMGEAAARRARERFTWDAVTSAHEAAIREAVSPRTGSLETSETGDATAVVLNFGAPFDMLERCLASVEAQTQPTEVILVDNGSPRNRDALDKVAEAFPSVRQIRLPHNVGFAAGMNAGIAEVRTDYVLVLNNDAELAPDAIERLAAPLGADRTLAGVAPKIVFAGDAEVFDAVGNVVTPAGSAFNRGIGQIDIGQYDRAEPTFGVCFAAALLRTELFHPNRVGPLDERYFMYYEDIDWCYRANVLGYSFSTAPDAVVRHEHSYTSRDLDYSFKYRLIERNFVRTVIKGFEARRALVYAVRRTVVQLRNALVRHIYPRESLRVIIETVIALPWLLAERRTLQRRRRRRDAEIVAFSVDEHPAYDPVRYAPERTPETIRLMYARRFRISGDPRDAAIAEQAAAATSDPGLVGLLVDLLRDEPPRVRELVDGSDQGIHRNAP